MLCVHFKSYLRGQWGALRAAQPHPSWAQRLSWAARLAQGHPPAAARAWEHRLCLALPQPLTRNFSNFVQSGQAPTAVSKNKKEPKQVVGGDGSVKVDLSARRGPLWPCHLVAAQREGAVSCFR